MTNATIPTKLESLLFLLLLHSVIDLKVQTISMRSGNWIVLSTAGYIAANNHAADGSLEFFDDVFTNGIR